MFTELKELSGGEIVPTVVLDDDGNIVETHDFTDIIGGAVAPVKFDVTLPVKVVYIDVYDPSIKTLPPIAHDIFYHGWAVKDSQLVYILGTSPNQNIKYLAGMLCLSAIESLNREYAKTNFSEELQNSVSAKLWESWFGMTTQDMTREGADLRSPVTPLPIQ